MDRLWPKDRVIGIDIRIDTRVIYGKIGSIGVDTIEGATSDDNVSCRFE